MNTGGGYYYAPPKQQKPRNKMSTSTVMMLIGTAFIILSAIAFVAANWVKMSPEGRVFVIVGAAILSFAISVVIKAAAKLELTSAAFYSIGSLLAVVSLVTAGNYELFGSWFCIGGEGAPLLYAISAFIISAAAFAAYPLYKKTAFTYCGLIFISIGLFLLCVQITDNYQQLAPVIALVQLVITAAVHLLKPQKGTRLEKPVGIIGDITAIFYALIAFAYVLGHTFNADAYSFFVLGIIMVQLFAYGVFKKQSWMFIILNILAVYTALTVVFTLEDRYGKDFIMLFFAFITLIIFLINRFAPKSNIVSEIFTLGAAIVGSVLSLCANNERYYGMNLIVPLTVSVFIAGYALHKSKAVQVTAGIFAPVLPFFSALYLNNRIVENIGSTGYYEVETLTFCGLAAVYAAVTLILLYLPKISFELHAHHPMKTQAILYSNMVAAFAVLMNCTGYSDLFMVTAALCIVHFIVSNLMSCNITAAGSVISLILLTYRVLQHYFGSDSEAAMYIMFGLFVLLLAVSRFVFRESFVSRTSEKTTVDVVLISAWTAVLPFPMFDRVSLFLRLMALAVFLASFVKKKTDKETAAILLSFSAFITAFAFLTRPFLTPDSSMISSKISLGIIALLGAAYRFIWRNHKTASKVTSTIVFVIAFIGLIIDAMVFHNAPNTIFAMAVTAGILILAFYTKSKTWFTASSIALVVITVFSTRKYFATMGWWIYLFIVGVVLIAIAAVNEYCKKKGETMRSTVSKKFSDWNW